MKPFVMEEITKIPDKTSGIYYFFDEDKRLLYVGRSRDIKKRFLQHINEAEKRETLEDKEFIDKIKSTKLYEMLRMFAFTIIPIDYNLDKVKFFEIKLVKPSKLKWLEKEKIKKLKPPYNKESNSDEFLQTKIEQTRYIYEKPITRWKKAIR